MKRSDERYKTLTDAEWIAALSEENTALADENAALRERLAKTEEAYRLNAAELLRADERIGSMEQRERAARAIIEPMAKAHVRTTPGAAVGELAYLLDMEVAKKARAWLADRAEQRAETQEQEAPRTACAECGAPFNADGQLTCMCMPF